MSRKREWHVQADDEERMESVEEDSVERNFKRVRLSELNSILAMSSFNYGATDMDTEMESAESTMPPASEYTEINALLREAHYLRQWRKFQSERIQEKNRQPRDQASAIGSHGATFMQQRTLSTQSLHRY
ncbi:TPA: hypothetical protein N0F65_008227 [Lagenidium giganteum]|uniref:Uncharacterized protein n=1 Tax=Lagenidium giganteum TaxID=4803 RepID=A0AAV2Z363_9STRA|nr:TPA: hypothetical protein N0F65_008227 [Lagenidium giganteum]